MYFCLISLAILLFFLFKKAVSLFKCGRRFDFDGKHVLVTGGTKGIGRSVVETLVENYKNVKITVIARSVDDLTILKNEIEKKNNTVEINIVPFDLSTLPNRIAEFEQVYKSKIDPDSKCPVNCLVNCAGSSESRPFTDTTPSDIAHLVNLNCTAALILSNLVVKTLKTNTNLDLSVTLISSIADEFPFFGFSVYSASKAALSALHQALQMELVKYPNASANIVYPPDTDTPGLNSENKTKHPITKLISGESQVLTSKYVALKIVSSIVNRSNHLHFNFEGNVIGLLSHGTSAIDSPWFIIAQLFVYPFARLLFLFHLHKFYRLVKNYK